MSRQSNFFEQVYQLVRQIPPGKVTSYGAVANMLGDPRATVGSDYVWVFGRFQRPLNHRAVANVAVSENEDRFHEVILSAFSIDVSTRWC